MFIDLIFIIVQILKNFNVAWFHLYGSRQNLQILEWKAHACQNLWTKTSPGKSKPKTQGHQIIRTLNYYLSKLGKALTISRSTIQRTRGRLFNPLANLLWYLWTSSKHLHVQLTRTQIHIKNVLMFIRTKS